MNEPKLNPKAPGVRWFPLLFWATRSTKGRRPARHRRAIAYLADLAIKAEVALYLRRHGRGTGPA